MAARHPLGRIFVILPPYLWLLLFFSIPFVIVFGISFSEADIAMPPYTPIFTGDESRFQVNLYFGNYVMLLQDSIYLQSYLQSLKVAAISTACCLLIGFPLAWAIVHSRPSTRNILLIMVILPSWTSFLIRVYAWMNILSNTGILNNVLMTIGIIDTPLQILNTDMAVYIGIVYSYLPFMVLPLYAAFLKLDYSLLEAAADLGARPVVTLFTIVIPLIKGGIIAGSMLVFIPAIGEYVIPELLGGSGSNMIGRMLWVEFFSNRDWPLASAMAIVMLVLLMLPIMLFHYYQRKEMEAA